MGINAFNHHLGFVKKPLTGEIHGGAGLSALLCSLLHCDLFSYPDYAVPTNAGEFHFAYLSN